MTDKLSIPPALVDAVAKGDAALFFGAGASKGASHPGGQNQMPTGLQLRDLICDEFLRGECKDRALTEVVGYVENEGGPVRLEAFIAKLMSEFSPSPGHLALPKFRWQAMYSLNYDRLIEDAYCACVHPQQQLHVIHKSEQAIDRLLRDNPGSLALFKLHGCIDRLNDRDAPLILSQDSYVTWHRGRERLYSRLQDSVAEYSMVFCGTTLADPHIQKLLFEASSRRPMQYIVSPGLNARDQALFASKRITAIPATFDAFMQALEGEVSPLRRRLEASLPQMSHSIERHFNKNAPSPPSILSFLDGNVDHVHGAIRTSAVSPTLFYKGESQSWSPIEQGLDIPRSTYEPFMLRILAFQGEDASPAAVVALQGVAGSGKTVFLRRAAFELATTYGQLVLFAPPRANLRAEPLRELFELTGKRTILLVDQAADQVSRIAEIVARLKGWSVPITLVVADTQAAFGNSLDILGEDLKFSYPLRQLSEKEVISLIAKLEEHRCLGILESATPAERIKSFMEVADRQLLVALYEATQGKPLEEILLDEYNRIALTEAQELYLAVCTLHQYKVPVRAGLIRRLTGLDFRDFESRLLGPLTDIVFAVKDPISRDWSYRARHSQIAQIVFKNVLNTNSKRVNQFIRIMTQMDISYSSDSDALRQMINYKNIRDVAPLLADRREILNIAESVTKGEPFALQQRALVEMNDAKGDLDVAKDYLDRAQSLRPHDRTLKHSRATLLARQAAARPNDLTRKVLRTEARSVLKSISKEKLDPYVMALTAQLLIDEIEDRAAESDGAEGSDAQFIRLVEEAETAIRDGLSGAPDFESLTISASRLQNLLGLNAKAVATLKKALDARPQLEMVAVAYARAIRGEDRAGALGAIKASLVHKPYSRSLNQALFELMLLERDDARDDLLTPLRRSFTNDDGNLGMHVHLLRYHYLRGETPDYEKAKSVARNLLTPIAEKRRPRFPYPNPATSDGAFEGTVIALAETNAYVRVRGMAGDVFITPVAGTDVEVWDELGKGRSIRFKLCFNAYGAVGVDVNLGR